MAMRSRTVVMGWGAMMLGLVLGGVVLTTSGSQAHAGLVVASGGEGAGSATGDAATLHEAEAAGSTEEPTTAKAVAAADRAAAIGGAAVGGAAVGDAVAGGTIVGDAAAGGVRDGRAGVGDAADDAAGAAGDATASVEAKLDAAVEAGARANVVAEAAASADDDRLGDRFDALVRSLQARDGVENTSPPFMWLASLAVRAARPAGVLDLRLATFEGRRLGDVAHDGEFQALVARAANDGWTPLLRVRSKRSRELVSIHTRTRGNQVSLLLVTVDQGDAVVAQVAVNPDTIAEWIKEPSSIDARLR